MVNILKKSGLFSMLATIGLSFGIAQANVVPLNNCAQLEKPKTVLLVHITGCHWCKWYMPKYKQVSNEAKFKEWTFYEKLNDDAAPVCGVTIHRFPSTYKSNMKNVLVGDADISKLEAFLEGSISNQRNDKFTCKQHTIK